MLEKAVEEIIKRFPREVFPDLDLTFVEGQRRLADGNILDLRFRDASGVHWVIELKRSRVTITALDQLGRYLEQLRRLEPTTRIEGIVVGFSVHESVTAAAALVGVQCRVLSEMALREIAERHGILIDHAAGYRPKLSGSNRSRSIVRERAAGPRPATRPEVVAFVRALDARFPPGSLNASVPPGVFDEYWRMACPLAPPSHQRLAARLTRAVLTNVVGTAIAARSQSFSDPYTTIRAGDGRVAAAIDARKSYVKLDFPLPRDIADEAKEDGLLTIWNPRGYSVWVQSRVGASLQVDHAEELLRVGLNWEFKGKRP
jgi:hypothetical protein